MKNYPKLTIKEAAKRAREGTKELEQLNSQRGILNKANLFAKDFNKRFVYRRNRDQV